MRAFVALLLVLALTTAALLATSSAVTPGTASASTGRAVMRGINFHRVVSGRHRVRWSHRLAHAAGYHSREMLAGDFFSHNSRNGDSFSTRIHRFARFHAVGETL